MSNTAKIVLCAISLAVSASALGCSYGRGYNRINPEIVDRVSAEQGAPAESPSGVSLELKRGYNDGDPASCSDAGILTIAFPESLPPKVAGILIHAESGHLTEVFPQHFVLPIRRAGRRVLRFIWLDWPRQNLGQEVVVRYLQRNGSLSEPLILELEPDRSAVNKSLKYVPALRASTGRG